MSRWIRTLASIGITLAALAALEPQALADSAQDFIQSRQTQVTALLHQSPGAQRDKQIAGVLDGMIDYQELAKRSLAAHWADITEVQRKDFTEVLKRLVQRNYERSIKGILDYRVEYLGEEPGAEGALVHTRASSTTDQREEPISIDYRVSSPASGTFKVIDVVTEGSSLVSNYKNQFHRVIQKDGFDALMKRMKDKLAKGQTV
jgi:phospholipid transport system substrate-binding protein